MVLKIAGFEAHEREKTNENVPGGENYSWFLKDHDFIKDLHNYYCLTF